jgi:hypothetical protein
MHVIFIFYMRAQIQKIKQRLKDFAYLAKTTGSREQ